MPNDAGGTLQWYVPLLGRAQMLCWRQGLPLCWESPVKALDRQALLRRLDQAALLVSLMTSFTPSDSIYQTSWLLNIAALETQADWNDGHCIAANSYR